MAGFGRRVAGRVMVSVGNGLFKKGEIVLNILDFGMSVTESGATLAKLMLAVLKALQVVGF